MRAFLTSLVLLVALPATAGAATVRVAPYSELPQPGGGCSKYSLCPADMVVFSAAPGELNDVSIAAGEFAGGSPASFRFIVRDESFPVEAGAGCERIDMRTAVCTAGVVGPVELGDLGDRIASPSSPNLVSGGAGDDVMSITGFGEANGGEGDDVVVGPSGKGGTGDDVVVSPNGEGGGGDDVLRGSGQGGTGNDILRCFAQSAACNLHGGPGNDRLTGSQTSDQQDQLFGGAGHDLLDGRDGKDKLGGGPGNDRLRGGGGKDVLGGGPGTDRLEARELRALGERTARDDVNCGAGRRDRAVADRRDQVTRCERVTRRRGRAG